MAESFTAYFSGIAFAASKNMAALLNTDATETIAIRRCGYLNAQTAAVTGVLCSLEVRGYFAGSPSLGSPTTVTPTAHDSSNTAAAALTAGSAGTIGGTATTFRRVFWSSDEAAIATATNDELETFVPLNIVFDAGYGDSNVQPLTLRENQMFLNFNASGAAGLLDTWIEFTHS